MAVWDKKEGLSPQQHQQQAAPAYRLPSASDAVAIPEAQQPPSVGVDAEETKPSAAVSMPCEGDSKQELDASPRRTVRFPHQPISAIWVADSVLDYNRRSIVVDLSKTPFALFRRDAVMMKQARTSVDPSAPLPPPGPPALSPPQVSAAAAACPAPFPAPPGRSPVGSPDAAAAADSDASPSPPSAERRRPRGDRLAKQWESESSESSEGHTDLETDDTETDWHSDADDCCSVDSGTEEAPPCVVVQQQLRRGSNSESGSPAFYGVWKRTSSEGYEELLLSSGVPKRAVAMAMKKHPVHIIDHDGSYFRLIVKNGLSKVDNTFFIGDEPKQDIIGKQSYEVSMNWAHLSGHGHEDELALTSICHQTGEEVIAIRSLHEGGDQMVLTQIVRRLAEGSEVRAKHFFKRVTSKSELRSGGKQQHKRQKGLSSTVVTVRRKK
ncbi:unnamed protein product [Ectocarpus sp. CCAP 1310/34]|nr:unnamed protein product [Ectocarpus sp. CCAP 1310/34]